MNNFEHIAVGDEVKVTRGRSSQQVAKVYHITPKQFKVEGYGSFWKKNGYGVGHSTSWFGSYANKLERGDRTRIAAANKRQKDGITYREHNVNHFNNDELARVVAIINECDLRLATESKAEEESNGL